MNVKWEQHKLGDFGNVQMNKRIFKSQTLDSGDVPFYKIGTFGKKADAYISSELYEEYRNKYPYPKDGDLLISASGSIGKIVEYKGQRAYYQDSNIVWLDHDNRILNLFLKAFFQIVKWNGTEGSTIKRLYNKNILNTEIILPKIKEQTAVGKLIEKFDYLITLQQRKLEQLKQLKKAILQIIASNRLLLHTKKVDMIKVRVADIYKITRGNVLSRSEISNVRTSKYPYPVYSSQTKNHGLMGYYKNFLFKNAITWTTDGANAGTVKYRKGRFYSTNVNGVLLSSEGLANQLTAELLNLVAFKYVSHVGNPKLMNNTMGEIIFNIPKSVETQQYFSGCIESVIDLIGKQEKATDKLNKLKKYLLQKLFI
nr:restriction endonuclease subunit S [Limosilactobacillus reuteri]